jgi:hypothetical protein
VAGVADMNGDGRPDLVLQHPATGTLVLWYMNGVQLVGSSMTNPTGPLDANWRIVSVLDLNGDGKPDFVMQHVVSGQLVAWFMSGTVVTSGALFTPAGQGDPNWKVTAVR